MALTIKLKTKAVDPFDEDLPITEDKTYRRTRFTFNNYPEGVEKPEFWKKLGCSYLVFGYEICPTTGTPHLQGYCEFNSSKRFKTLKNFNVKISWRRCNASGAANTLYCLKEKRGHYTEGKMKAQGTRTDILNIKDLLDNGESHLEVAEQHFACYIRNFKGFDRYSYLKSMEKAKENETREVYVEIRWGPTGTGKTTSAKKEARALGLDYYVASMGATNFWWTGYNGEPYVILDEFRENIPLNQLLRILDENICQVSVHGGQVPLMATTIIITSNTNPADWYANCDYDSRNALCRRIKKVAHMTEVPKDAPKWEPAYTINRGPTEDAPPIYKKEATKEAADSAKLKFNRNLLDRVSQC